VSIKQDSSNQVMQHLYRRDLEPRINTLPKNSTEGFSRLCADPKYIFLESVMYYTVLKPQKFIPCDVMEVPETHKRERVSIAIKKGSPYLKIFNYKYVCQIRRQMERVGSMPQTCIREVVGAPVVLIQVLCGIRQPPQDKCQGLSQLGHYSFIPNSMQFIIHYWKVFYPKNGDNTFIRSTRKFNMWK